MQLAKMTKNYETLYLCGQLEKIIGRRYNIRPDLPEDAKHKINGYVYKETITGLFRAWVLNEMNMGVAKVVNKLMVASLEQIIKEVGLEENTFLKIIEECVEMALLCENRVIFKNDDDIILYMVDTGGIFAFEEAGVQYKKLAYTISIDQRLKIYRKNIFIVQNSEEAVNLHLFEDTLGMPGNEKYNGSTLLVDMSIAKKLGIEKDVEAALTETARVYNASIYDTAAKKYLDKQ